MPTFKHPCPHCATFIERDVATCPACGRADPFAPGRCPSCRAVLDDPTWVACPKCGTSLVAAPTSAADAEDQASGGATAASPPESAAAATCAACGSPLPAGARFCRDCGTVVA
jgi:RNA polymerase subunit RPABC4/transcription elongation factor Spt4